MHTEVLTEQSHPHLELFSSILVSSLIPHQSQWLKTPKESLGLFVCYLELNAEKFALLAFPDHNHRDPSRPPCRNFALTCRCFSLSFHFLLPHVLYQYLQEPKRAALKMKERNFTLCQKKEWKLRAVSDNWACRKRHVNNRQRCRRLVTPYPGWQTLSAVDELF